MATAIPLPSEDPDISIEEGRLIIRDFCETDPEVVAAMQESDDLGHTLHRQLAVGARALRAAQASVDSTVVERAFDEMRSTFRASIEDFTREISHQADKLLDEEEGEIPKTLDEFRADMGDLLDQTFDPNSKQSVVTKLGQVLEQAGQDQLAAVRRLIDPDNDESPLGRYRSEIVRTVEKQAESVLSAFGELKTQLAVEAAKAEAFEQTSAKGFSFEEAIELALTSLVAGFEDVAERVGGTAGANGRKGDFVVTLNAADTGGQDARYVIEAKDSPRKLPEILKELDEAIENRGAVAGIAVFARPEQSPVRVPFQTFDNKAIIVFDKEAPNELALRLACCWARWVARRQLARLGDEIDLERISAQIEAARHALGLASKIRRALNGSKTQIDRALAQMESLVADAEAALQGLESELAA
jgi:hypothetical protein